MAVNQLFENKTEQLLLCLRQMFPDGEPVIETVVCEDLREPTHNFTTGGIFRLRGEVIVGYDKRPWTLIVKAIKRDSPEKDDPWHHNYWKREALVFQSGILDNLPSYIGAVKCYLLEEQLDGSIWIWMEHAKGVPLVSDRHFARVARYIGQLGGAYLTGAKLPEEEWICKRWLWSWVQGSREYAPDVEDYADRLSQESDRSIWLWFKKFSSEADSGLNRLNSLPRVLAHQDLSWMNMFLEEEEGDARLTLIDWQFMSLSGVGEDLAKLFGVIMSLEVFPLERCRDVQASLFQAYVQGLRQSGWWGDERVARYGFCLAVAMRSIWEVPKYIELAWKLESGIALSTARHDAERLKEIIAIQMELAEEAESLQPFL